MTRPDSLTESEATGNQRCGVNVLWRKCQMFVFESYGVFRV